MLAGVPDQSLQRRDTGAQLSKVALEIVQALAQGRVCGGVHLAIIRPD